MSRQAKGTASSAQNEPLAALLARVDEQQRRERLTVALGPGVMAQLRGIVAAYGGTPALAAEMILAAGIDEGARRLGIAG